MVSRSFFLDRVPPDNGFNKVICNTKLGSTAAVALLISEGYKKIAFINGPQNLETSIDRLEGYMEGHKLANLEINNSYIKHCNLTRQETNTKFIELFENEIKPDAVVTFNNYTCQYAMVACRKMGFIPNKDIAFVNFGNFPFPDYMERPPLAYIEQFPIEMGISAANLLMECINETNERMTNKEILIQSKLILN